MSETQENPTPPTEHAIRRAREEGKFAFSENLAVAVSVIGILGLSVIFGKTLLNAAIEELGDSLSSVKVASDSFVLRDLWDRPILEPVAWFMGSTTLVVILSRVMQMGVLFRPSRALPNANNVDFTKGVQRIFTISNLVRCLQIVLATAAFVVLLIVFFAQNYASIVSLGIAEVERMPGIVSAEFAKLFGIATVIALVVGMVDYYWQRTKFLGELQKEENAPRQPIQAIFNERRSASRHH